MSRNLISSRRCQFSALQLCASVLALGIFTAQAAHVKAALVSYWGFNEGAGITANDPVSGNNGTLQGTNPGLPTWVAGHTGNAGDFSLDFVGGGAFNLGNGGQNVLVPNSASLQITGDQTISFWLNTDAPVGADRQNPFAKAYAGEGTITLEPNATLNYYYGQGGGNNDPYQGVTSAGGPIANTWEMFTVVRDFDPVNQDTVTWYKNGVLLNVTNASFDPAVAGTLPLYLGSGYTNTLDGRLDDVVLLDEAITLGEIKSMYALSADPNNALSPTYDIQDLYQLWTIFDGGPGSEGMVNGERWLYTDELDTTGRTLGDAWEGQFTYLWLAGAASGLQQVTPAPEPSTSVLMSLGALALLRRRRRA